MKTDTKISEISNIEETTDFSNWKPYPPEFVHFTQQLRNMKKWFIKYNKAYENGLFACAKIDDSITDIANAIGVLASCEFVDSYLFEQDKSNILKSCSV